MPHGLRNNLCTSQQKLTNKQVSADTVRESRVYVNKTTLIGSGIYDDLGRGFLRFNRDISAPGHTNCKLANEGFGLQNRPLQHSL